MGTVAQDKSQIDKIYRNAVKAAVANVGGSIAWSNFGLRIHKALVSEEILWWGQQQDESAPSNRIRFITSELWGRMMGDEDL